MSLASYSPWTLFLTFRTIWGSHKWSHMIPLCQKTWGLTPKSSVRFKLIISLLEEVLGLLQPLHPFLGLQINLRRTKMVPHDSPWFPMPKNMEFDTKIKCLYHDQKYLTLSENLIPPDVHECSCLALQSEPQETHIFEFLTKNYLGKWPQSPGILKFTDFFFGRTNAQLSHCAPWVLSGQE